MRVAVRTHTPTHRDGSGRLHLDLRHDPTNGRARLVLREPIFEGDWQNDLATAAANTALGTLCEQASMDGALDLARHAMTVASQLADDFIAQLPAGTIACKAGCDHCCHQAVHVTPVEALAIADHLRRNLAPAELAALGARIAEASRRTRDLAPFERFSSKHPCPFLEGGRCSIYDVRPLACRGMNSRDADGCGKVLQDPAARAAFLSNPRAGYSFAEPIRAALAISAGLQLALAEVYQLDMHPLDLIAAVDLLLSGDGSIPAGWLSGWATFERARVSRGPSDAWLRQLSGLVVSDPSPPDE